MKVIYLDFGCIPYVWECSKLKNRFRKAVFFPLTVFSFSDRQTDRQTDIRLNSGCFHWNECNSSKIRVQCGSVRVQCGSVRVQCGSVRVQCGSVRVQCGSVRVQCGSARVQCGSVKGAVWLSKGAVWLSW